MRKRGKLSIWSGNGTGYFVRPSLPETKMFSGESFVQMINRYGAVIVKPNWGLGGQGVMKVSRLSNGKYLIHYGMNRQVFSSKQQHWFVLRQYISHRPYIVQRYISMCKVNGRPFDLRVMLQRKKGIPWTVTGKLAKVAGPNRIITNTARSKGYVLPAMSALTKTFSRRQSELILNKLDQICLHAAKHWERHMGLESMASIWPLTVMEIHGCLKLTKDRLLLLYFRKLKDKSYYHKILATAPTRNYHKHFTGGI